MHGFVAGFTKVFGLSTRVRVDSRPPAVMPKIEPLGHSPPAVETSCRSKDQRRPPNNAKPIDRTIVFGIDTRKEIRHHTKLVDRSLIPNPLSFLISQLDCAQIDSCMF
ncbi:hypothetical protein PGT21_035530 [Puccinia graminis f. sp. tritici]|uniref:Uncharacterized protein n=1 Tax=Puccinia graminis f. sp. tritici TaxID=56615 RepID=A0A5B0MZY8_PUCGR|nr:hypothetical protein PGT21_035530 [Puccinia graminis f. sp. tritici]